MEGLYKNKDWLYNQYIILRKSMQEIADICECSSPTIGYWLRKHNIPIRSLSEAMNTKRCKQKHSEIMKKRKQELGYINSPEARKKLSKSKKGKYIGKNNPFYGKKHSPESRKQMSETRKQKFENGEIERPIGDKNSHYGKPPWNKGKIGCFSPETLKQMSNSQKELFKNGYIHPMKDKHHTPKSRKLMSKTWKELYKNDYINPMYGKPREDIKGKNHYNWNPNRAEVYAPYGENFYNKELRNKRWNLQNGRDLLTGDKLEWGFYSKYHHIDWDKSNDNPDNHIWTNYSTHGKIHTNRKRKYYESILQNNLKLLKQGKIPENWTKKNKEMFRQESLIQLQLINFQIIEKEWCYGG